MGRASGGRQDPQRTEKVEPFSVRFSFLLTSTLPLFLFFSPIHHSILDQPIMFAARQSFNLFQKRAFSASASQVCPNSPFLFFPSNS